MAIVHTLPPAGYVDIGKLPASAWGFGCSMRAGLTRPLFRSAYPTMQLRAVTQFSSILGTCTVLSYFVVLFFVSCVTFSVLVSRVTTFLGKYLLESKTTACAPISTNSSRP